MKKRSDRTSAWLSCNLRLDEIRNKEQAFTITGWINCIWKEPKNTKSSSTPSLPKAAPLTSFFPMQTRG